MLKNKLNLNKRYLQFTFGWLKCFDDVFAILIGVSEECYWMECDDKMQG